MRHSFLIAVLAVTLTLAAPPAQAQPTSDFTRLQNLKLSESQVQGIFSLFLSQAPAILSDSADARRVVDGIAPQALRLLNADQRSMLEEMAPQETLRHFGSMSREERRRFMFDSAQGLVHPSKQEWIRRAEQMLNDSDGF